MIKIKSQLLNMNVVFGTMLCKYCKHWDETGIFEILQYDDGYYYGQCNLCYIFGGYCETIEELRQTFKDDICYLLR